MSSEEEGEEEEGGHTYLARSMISLLSMANTCFAPAFAANMDKMPVPQPMSMTTLSLKVSGLFNMKSR